MKQTINANAFHDAFKDFNRLDTFSYEGRQALFNYLEVLEEDCAIEIELDVIGLCCEYQEDTLDHFLEQHDLKSIGQLRDSTQVIEIEGSNNIIIASF
jgi:hypothetical protein